MLWTDWNYTHSRISSTEAKNSPPAGATTLPQEHKRGIGQLINLLIGSVSEPYALPFESWFTDCGRKRETGLVEGNKYAECQQHGQNIHWPLFGWLTTEMWLIWALTDLVPALSREVKLSFSRQVLMFIRGCQHLDFCDSGSFIYPGLLQTIPNSFHLAT